MSSCFLIRQKSSEFICYRSIITFLFTNASGKFSYEIITLIFKTLNRRAWFIMFFQLRPWRFIFGVHKQRRKLADSLFHLISHSIYALLSLVELAEGTRVFKFLPCGFPFFFMRAQFAEVGFYLWRVLLGFIFYLDHWFSKIFCCEG